MKSLIATRPILIGLILCAFAVAQGTPTRPDEGDEWLSWTPVQRTAYVGGFIDGYLGGFLRACQQADRLFEIGKPHHLGDGHSPQDMPSARCLLHRGEFALLKFNTDSQPDWSTYTEVITMFYERHATCRHFPFPFLLEVLSHKYRSADGLYELAMKGALEDYPRSRQWCSAPAAMPAK